MNVAGPRVVLFALAAMAVAQSGAAIDVPAFTAYVHPDPSRARVGGDGISGWSDCDTTIEWHGLVNAPGELTAGVIVAADGPPPRLSLAVGDQVRPGVPSAMAAGRIDFGSFRLEARGFATFVLRLDEPADRFRVERLVLDGPAAADARFNLTPRRNAASVHLAYPVEPPVDVRGFSAEATAVEAPIHTFVMACGWHRGYLGMQVNSPTERRIIFSVWDSGGEVVDRRRVADADRVRLVAKGEGVVAGDFGDEGTGGHSHLAVPWRTGAPQRFLVTATPRDGSRAVFAGYWFHQDERRWLLISAWDAPHETGTLRGLHGFSENFVGDTGDLLRRSLHGNQWIRTAAGEWREITRATFSHDATGKADRLDRCMGLEGDRFFLAHGGFRDCFTRFGAAFERPAGGRPPDDLDLPPLPDETATPGAAPGAE